MTVPDFLNMVDKLKLDKQEGIASGPAIKAFGFANTKWAVMKKDEEQVKRFGKRDYQNEIDKLRILLPSYQQGGKNLYQQLENNIKVQEQSKLKIKHTNELEFSDENANFGDLMF